MTSEFRAPSMEDEAFADELVSPDASIQGIASPTFAGLDTGSYPGPEAMDAYRNAGFSVTGLYLSHGPARSSPNRVDTKWIAAATHLSRQGWGLAPIYVGAEPAGSSSVPPPTSPLDDARIDANEALDLARRAGLETGRTIFLDVEQAFSADSPYESYALRWIELVRTAKYVPALYCFRAQASWCAAQGIKIWTVHLNSSTGKKNKQTGAVTWSDLSQPLPADSVDAGAIGTQGRFYCRAASLRTELDYDRWTVADPSRL